MPLAETTETDAEVLSGAVSFSQGTNDYFQTDYANALARRGPSHILLVSMISMRHSVTTGLPTAVATIRMMKPLARAVGRNSVMAITMRQRRYRYRSEIVLGHAQSCAKRTEAPMVPPISRKTRSMLS